VDITPAGRRRRSKIAPLVGLGLLVAAAVSVALAVTLLRIDGAAPSPAGDETPREHAAPVSIGVDESDGSFAFWGRSRSGGPLRWDACSPIPFVVNLQEAPESAEEDLLVALRMLADASGLELVLVGSTEERPERRRPLVEPQGAGWRWRPVLVAWATPATTDIPLTASDRGVALPVAVRDGEREAFVTGQLVMNADRIDLVPGFGDRSDAVGATLVHELGHILGLDHVDDPAQLMSTDPGSGPVELGPGDLRGLRAVGADAGCLAVPPPASGRGLVATP